MEFDVVRGKIVKSKPTENLVESVKKYFDANNDNGTLYLGFPLSATPDSKVTIDALLISKNCGLIAFIFPSNLQDNSVIMEEQDTLYFNLDYNLKKYIVLKRGRELSFKPIVISLFPDESYPKDLGDDYIFASSATLSERLKEQPGIEEEIYKKICQSLQRATNMKPKKKRENVKKEESYGGKIKKIEKEIANLDQWQKKAAFETPEGPQRIRGLAGSGKTIVLALKVAYLHSQYPDWNIAITFYTRSLSQQLTELIRQFYFDYSGEEPDWEKVHVVHAWGTNADDGIYSIAAQLLNVTPLNLTNATNKYGRVNAFNGICRDLLTHKDNKSLEIFDAVLIDEAQDLPSSFFRIVYKLTKSPKRITWAYDELQNLSEIAMPSLEEMFGKDPDGNLNVIIENKPNEPKRDIILPICYRNPPWALSIAHSLGFGIYRDKVIQMFDELQLWQEIGYERIGGKLEYGKQVVLKRKAESIPNYFTELIKPEECIQANKFNTYEEQYEWIATEILKNIEKDELDPDDILVIFPDAYKTKRQFYNFRDYLDNKGINSVLVGVDTSRDTFRVQNNISCTHIYRAKGNEAPMVYIVNADECAKGYELIKLRNTLFTAITRSRAWVRICGVGEDMDLLKNEINKCIDESYSLKFKLPTKSELESIRRINRERTQEEVKRINGAQNSVKQIIEDITKGELDIELLPQLDQLLEMYKKSKAGIEDNEE